MKSLSNTMISALRSSKPSNIGVMACTTRTGKALESRGLASPYYHLATDVVPHYQISAAGREHLARIERMESALRAEQCRTDGDGLSIRTSLRTVHAEICTCQI